MTTNKTMHKLQMYYPSLNKLVYAFFAQFKVLLGKPHYKTFSSSAIRIYDPNTNKETNNLFVVQIPYFAPLASTTLNDTKVAQLGSAITRLVNTLSPVQKGMGWEVEIRLIRLRYPYLDCTILAKYLALNAGKYNFNRIQKGVFNKTPVLPMDTVLPFSNETVTPSASSAEPMKETFDRSLQLPSLLTGVKLELAGRLTTQQSIPRKTVDNTHTGSFTVSQSKTDTADRSLQLNSSLNFSQYASKNKLGAFTLKVWLSHKKA